MKQSRGINQTLRVRKRTSTRWQAFQSKAACQFFFYSQYQPEPTVKLAEAARQAWMETQEVRRRSNEETSCIRD